MQGTLGGRSSAVTLTQSAPLAAVFVLAPDDQAADERADEPRADVRTEHAAIAHADQPAKPCADQPADRGADD